VSTVYLLHFDRPYSTGGQQHYIGWAFDLDRRLAQHRAGDPASKTTRRAWLQGIGFTLARQWPGGPAEERKLKRVSGRWLCPLCTPMALARTDGVVRAGRHAP
jgi:predicted GIY-YIG superfamily endonuclease